MHSPCARDWARRTVTAPGRSVCLSGLIEGYWSGAPPRGSVINKLSTAVTQWCGAVPKDPGVAELADLLEEAATALQDK